MADRITNERIERALENLALTLTEAGICTPEQVEGLQLAQPYGLCYYVCRYMPDGSPGMPLHDVPGFVGSTEGYVTRREAYDAIRQTSRAIYQATNARITDNRAGMMRDHLQRGAEWRAMRAEVSA